jgi:hypothetical protein
MFDLPGFAEPSDEIRAALVALGAPGGPLDANDDLAAGPVELITDPALSINNPNNPEQTAGATFVGQFLDHDITADAGSRLGRPTSLRRSRNLRSARFDLDSVYGGGPEQSPDLYESADPTRLRIESGGRFEDLPRDAEGVAILGDGRNDENLIISGLHAAFLKFHNAVAERSAAAGDGVGFDATRRQVRWHYQWLILNEFLPAFVGATMVNNVLTEGRRFYQPSGAAQIPVEFSTSAYRFGHSLIRPSYRANMAGQDGDPFFGLIFDPSQFGADDPDDLTGRSRAPRRYIGWQTFFDFDDGEVKPNKAIDATISTPLFQLPIFAISSDRGEDVGPTSLATRNLLRHLTWEIPSGQAVAAAMGAPVLSQTDLADFGQFGGHLDTSTPLWLYILREAMVMSGGGHLGPVGGRIVAEVFIGLLQLDEGSYLAAATDWQPDLPQLDSASGFRMVDLLTVAGVDPICRGE